jgi:hypothetical protein
LRLLLVVTLLVSGAVVLARAALGPFHFLVWVRSPLVAEGVCALAATTLLLFNRRQPLPAKTSSAGLAAVVLLTGAATVGTLFFPLVCDEYTLAAEGRAMSWAAARDAFTHPGIDPFFRPLADLTLRLDAVWAGDAAWRWRMPGFLLHLLNTALVFWLAQRLFQRPALACWAAALFGVHGSRPEAVVFLARFDQLAALCVLAGLLLFDRYLESGRKTVLAASHVVVLAGLLSKESAYAFPLLAVWMLVWRGRRKPRELRAAIGFFALAGAAFVYRWSVLGGIGGYPDRATGRAAVLNIRPLALLKGFTLRLWGLLYFPIDWSRQPEPWLAAAVALAVAGLVCLAIFSRSQRRPLAFAAAFALIASLPVAHMLLIGADLEGAAHLYLPSLGFCLFVAVAIDAIPRARVASAAGGMILAFQLAALAHNMTIWSRAAHLADDACRFVARVAASAPQAPIVQDPPRILDGVPFFANGLAECVAMRAPAAGVRVVFGPDLPPAGPRDTVLVWNEAGRRFEVRRLPK